MAIRVDNLEIRAKWAGGQSVTRGTRNVERDLDKVRTSTARVNAGLVSMGRLFGVAIGIETIRRVYVAGLEMAKLAATVRTTEQAFDNLATKAGRNTAEELNRMREAVGGTLGDLELMQRVGGAVDAGLKFDQAITALEFLRRHSLAFGKDFNQLTRTVFTGLARGSVLFLDDAGIILSATDKMFDGMDDLEKKTALVAEAIRLMGVKMKDLPEIADTVVTATGQVSAEWKKLEATIGKSLEGFFHERAQKDLAILKFINTAVESLESGFAHLSQLGVLFGARPELVAQDFGSPLTARQDDFAEVEKEVREARLRQQGRVGSARGQELLDVLEKTIRLNEEFIKREQEYLTWVAQVEAREQDRVAAAKQVADEREREAEAYTALLHAGQIGGMTGLGIVLDTVGRPDPDVFAKEFAAQTDAYIQFFEDLERAEAEASNDRIAIIEDEFARREREMQLFAIEVIATEEEIARFTAALERQKTIAIKSELDRRQSDAEQAADRQERERKKAEANQIRKILLLFEADTTQVRDQADLAAFSVGLFAQQLSEISPQAARAVRSVEQMVVALQQVGAGGKLTAGGIAGLVAGGVGLLTSTLNNVFNASMQAREQIERMNEAIRGAADSSGALAKELGEKSIKGNEQVFKDFANQLFSGEFFTQTGQQLSDAGDLFKEFIDLEQFRADTQGLRSVLEDLQFDSRVINTQGFLEVIEELKRAEEALRAFGGESFGFNQALDQFSSFISFSGVEDPQSKLDVLQRVVGSIIGLPLELQRAIDTTFSGISEADLAALRQNFTGISIGKQNRLFQTIAQLQRDIQQAELDARQEQADALIDNIERNKIAILRAIDDAEEAQKQATLRAVGLQFDAREAGLRSQFFGQITGSRTDPLERERVLEDLQREIELLRVQEQAATVAELGRIRVSFDEARQAQEDQVTEQIRAVERATENLGVTFENALGLEIGGMTSTFDQVLSVTRMMQDTSNVQPVVTSVHQLSDVTRMMQDTSNVQPVVTSVHQLSDVTRMMQDTSNVQPVVTSVHQLSDVTRMMQDTSNVQPVVTSVHQLSDVTRMMQDTSNVQPVVTSVHQLSATFDQVLHVTRMMQDTSNVQPVVTSVHQLSEDVTGAINTALDFGPVQVQMELIQRSTDALGADFGTWMTWSTDRIVNAVNNPTWAATGGGTTVNFGNISLGNSGLSISDVRRMFQRELLPLIINEIIDGKLSARAQPTFRSGLGQGVIPPGAGG